jgi:hypothetical protein
MNKHLDYQQEKRHAAAGIEYITATRSETGEEFVFAITIGQGRRDVHLVTYETKPSLVLNRPRVVSTWHEVDEQTRAIALEQFDLLQQLHANRGAA